jgi:hypothetical protein
MTQVTTQDKDISESKQYESVGEEELEAAEVPTAVEASTIRKGKWCWQRPRSLVR